MKKHLVYQITITYPNNHDKYIFLIVDHEYEKFSDVIFILDDYCQKAIDEINLDENCFVGEHQCRMTDEEIENFTYPGLTELFIKR